ncbi:Unsaturated rhamnogalacturonyl hydrolase YesR [Vanrija pseudolonga]|uniref:Unsaturated rhamnogalacturonyl hydrolase YesR n=1 Tax=Vanrija pseudolonga TaxID=143232 RepID=A0AAF0YB45_9TREE|nr:Unsaturated rhamnogalacturonyl hydrolase YesR [Vanrija pseudolonga]
MKNVAVAVAALAAAPAVLGAVTHLTDDCLEVVFKLMNNMSHYSWENGTRSQAILEWKYPQLSVFTPNALFPVADTSNISDIVDIAHWVLLQRPQPLNQSQEVAWLLNATHGGLPPSPSPVLPAQEGESSTPARRDRAKRQDETPTSSASAQPSATSSTPIIVPFLNNTQLPLGAPLLPDGAAGDPASLGIAVMLANMSTNNAVVNNSAYGDSATSELNYQLYHVPRAPNGAISHRTNEVALWADNVYMVPPFLAYYGALNNNKTLLDAAYNQISTYRSVLRNSSINLWQHIALGKEAIDPGYWATGNAWAVAGMARVIATIKHSSFANDMKQEVSDLSAWADEIFKASEALVTPNGLVRNYINNASSFEDSTASALFAAAGLRFSTLKVTNSYVNFSLTLLKAVSHNVNSTGYVTQVTDPLKFTVEGTESPEAQSFVILAYAAYKDWDKMGKPGNTGSKKDPLTDAAGRASVHVGAVLAVAASMFWVLA